MHTLQKVTMSLMVFLMFAIILVSKTHARVEPQDLVGEYLGSGNCAVTVSLHGDDQLKFSILDDKGEAAFDFLPFYRLETLTSPDEFEFERETVGISGQEKRVVSGTIRGGKLGSLKLRTVRSLFSFSSTTCYGLAPLAPYISRY